MHKVGINFDEISDDLDIAIKTMRECDVVYGELRTVNGKNFVFWSDDEISDFKKKVNEAGIELIAAATPLFKWYTTPDDEEIKHDSFGFNPRLDNEEKKQVIVRAIEIAHTLSIPRLRIFSGLGRDVSAGRNFAHDPLLIFALDEAAKYGIDLYLENEPVCRVHNKQQILDLLENQQSASLKLWLDIANLVELDEDIDEAFIQKVADRLGYVHIKDFNVVNGRCVYVPVGQGQIHYAQILNTINSIVDQELIFTVETHAKTNKINASIASIKATRQLVSNLK